MELQLAIHLRGGLAATHELLRSGHSQSRLRRGVASGQILRVRKGWYCLPELAPTLQLAARVGGRLTCLSAAELNGLWVPEHPPQLHVAVAPNACQLRSATNYRKRLASRDRVVLHWADAPDDRLQVTPEEAIAQLCRCQPADVAFVVCESALDRSFLTLWQWHRVLEALPVNVSRALSGVSALSASGTESMFKFGMLAAGIAFRQQVQLGIDRVDFVLGQCLVVEIDSRAHHDAGRDRERDARLSILGFRVLRFDYHQVTWDWPTVLASVRAALLRGDHLA